MTKLNLGLLNAIPGFTLLTALIIPAIVNSPLLFRVFTDPAHISGLRMKFMEKFG
jgi:hypothetical protein